MEELNLPAFPFRFKDVGQRKYIFDSFRKKYILLTPEENVRQHFSRYLTEILKYPAGRIALEVSLKYGTVERRCDIVVYNRRMQPALIIECKSASIEINEAVFDQVVRYNMVLKSAFIGVTNGKKHYCCKINLDSGKYEFLSKFPDYDEIDGASE
jgi:hypothetical protein